MEHTTKLNNGLLVSIDYLRFTVINLDCIDDILNILGFSRSDFSQCPRGGLGYKSSIVLNGSKGFRVYFDGNPDMGICFEISGSAMSFLFKAFRSAVLNSGFAGISDEELNFELLRTIKDIGHYTRLDIAVDDKGNQFFSCDDIERFYRNKQIVARSKVYKRDISEKDYIKTGDTIYFGSRSSDIMLRVYDKQLEQNQKLSDDRKIDYPWTRFEFELKNDRANKFVDILLEKKSLGFVTMGIFNNYFRIVERNDTNISRCSMLPLWQEFVSTVEKIRLSEPQSVSTLEQSKLWILDKVSCKFAAIYMNDGGDLSFIYECLSQGCKKLLKNKPCIEELGGIDVVLEAIDYFNGIAE
ncbi:MAG: replication initiation factor domain-containing protein [Eubacteriales bacterium]|nr:replication initiation factor domain-containing protein [Eubacteriales bacterium]